MAVKLTKNELKTQKDQLKQFKRYLPTLQLKKQQLQLVIMQVSAELAAKEAEQAAVVQGLNDWIAVFSENKSFSAGESLVDIVKLDHVERTEGNIAGVSIPIFKCLTFKPIEYEVKNYPLWVDAAIIKLREIARLGALVSTLKLQIQLLEKELRTTSQRVNLFEKVKIPEAKDNIRRIGIYLGDQQTSAVVRGKIAKKKISEGGQA